MIPQDDLLNISSGFGQNCKFLFFKHFFHSAFHLVFVVATTNLSFYCSHFEWPEIWHADVSWPLQNWVDFGHHLLIFLILASFWLSETGQIWGFWRFSSECMGGMAWNLTCRCILTAFSTVYILVMVCWFSSFWLSETSQICSFWVFSWGCIGRIGWTNLVPVPDCCVVRLF